jgi:hypothetical protein
MIPKPNLLKNFSYDNQQEDIYINPRQLSF